LIDSINALADKVAAAIDSPKETLETLETLEENAKNIWKSPELIMHFQDTLRDANTTAKTKIVRGGAFRELRQNKEMIQTEPSVTSAEC
jgi:hypothetical protein